MLRFPRALSLLVSTPFVALTSCAAPPAGLNASAASSLASVEEAPFDDPAGFCVAVGTADRPEDEGYTGPKMPAWMVHALLTHAGVLPDDADADVALRGEWRCADGAVLFCSYGANIPCRSKADTETTPGEGARVWCGEHPDAEFVPRFATGRETVFGWRCEGTEPAIDRQWFSVDAQGYQTEFWQRIGPGTGDPTTER